MLSAFGIDASSQGFPAERELREGVLLGECVLVREICPGDTFSDISSHLVNVLGATYLVLLVRR